MKVVDKKKYFEEFNQEFNWKKYIKKTYYIAVLKIKI